MRARGGFLKLVIYNINTNATTIATSSSCKFPTNVRERGL